MLGVACSTGALNSQAGSGAVDSGSLVGGGPGAPGPGDAALGPFADARSPGADAVEATADTGEPSTDADESTADVGEPTADAGEPTPDVGESIADTGEPTPDAAASPPPPGLDAAAPPPPPPVPTGHYASTLATVGTADTNLNTYLYAPAFVYDAGLYHFFACAGVQGDWILHKSAPTLAGLENAPGNWALSPAPGENHNCDPAVIRGADGQWYLHYSNTPGGQYTDAGVAVAPSPEGPYRKLSMDLLGHFADLSPGQYGRGQTTVTRGPDGLYYMAFTNQIEPLEPMGIVVLRSAEPSFSIAREEVTRIGADRIGGWSTQLSYDPRSGHFVFIEPAGANGFVVTSFDAQWAFAGQEVLALPPGAGVPGEGQAFLTDAEGRLLVDSPDAHGSLVVVGATNGPERGGIPTWITGPSQFRVFRANPVGVVDAVVAVPGAVQVAGWSFDPNDRGFPLETHVYVGRPGGAERTGTNLGLTRVPRPDVNATQGTSGDHGFWAEIPTALRGEVEVCLAAINIGAGDNEWLACRNVAVGP